MKVRSLTADEHDACRAKGTQRVEKLLGGLKHLPEDQQFHGLHVQFEAAAHALESCSENFQGEDYVPADLTHVMRDEAEMVLVKKAGVTAKETAILLLDAMAKSPLSRVNGTSLVFQQCAGKIGMVIPSYQTQQPSLVPSDIVFDRELAYK